LLLFGGMAVAGWLRCADRGSSSIAVNACDFARAPHASPLHQLPRMEQAVPDHSATGREKPIPAEIHGK